MAKNMTKVNGADTATIPTLAEIAVTMGNEARAKADSGSTAEAFVRAGLRFGADKPKAAEIDEAVTEWEDAYKTAANVTADDKTMGTRSSNLRAFIAMGAMRFGNEDPEKLANRIASAAAKKVKVTDPVTGQQKEKARVAKGFRELIYSASVYLQKHHADGAALSADAFEKLMVHLEPEADNAEKALKRVGKACRQLVGLMTDEEVDACSTDLATAIAALIDAADREVFTKAKVTGNAALDRLKAAKK